MTVARLEKDILRIPIVETDDQIYYALQPKQYECFALTPLARDPSEHYPEHIGYGGSAGGGKSHLARAVVVAAAFLWPGSTSIIFRRTEREVVENHVNPLRLEVPDHDKHGNRIYSFNGQDMCIHWYNGSRTYFGYLKSDADIIRYQGNAYDVMVFEEASHYTWRSVSWLTGNRLRATVTGSRPFAVYPSNPGGPGHMWYKRLFIERIYYEEDGEDPADYAFVQARLADNEVLQLRDPKYAKRLDRLPEPWRSFMRDGDFAAGAGAALPELRRDKHLVDPFKIPAHWVLWGSFDWGYRHPWSFGVYASDEDSNIYKLETITGMLMSPQQIVQRIRDQSPVHLEMLSKIVAGHDLWAQRKAYGEVGKSLYERFADLGMLCIQADIDRVQGLESLRNALAWETQGLEGEEGEPRFVLFDTEGNRKCYRTLENMTPDVDRMEDVLKVDADERGEGGDDSYDETRYAVHTYPMVVEQAWAVDRPMGWSPGVLAWESEESRRRHTRDEIPNEGGEVADHLKYGEFGVWA